METTQWFFIFIYLFIFDVGHFKVYYFLQFYVWNFWPQGLWGPSSQPGIKSTLPALEGKILTTGSPRKAQLNAKWF